MSTDYLVPYAGARAPHQLDMHIEEIRRRLSDGEQAPTIARRFGVTGSTMTGFMQRRGLAKRVQRAAPVIAVRAPSPKPIGQLAIIKHAVCARFGMTLQQIESETRSRPFSWPRQLAMALSRDLAVDHKGNPQSYPAIGKRYGNRDHTTVLSACKAIEGRIKTNMVWAEHYYAVKHFHIPVLSMPAQLESPSPANDGSSE